MSTVKMKAPVGFSSMTIGDNEYSADNNGFVYVRGHDTGRALEHGCKHAATPKLAEPPAVEPQVGGTGTEADRRRAEAAKAARQRAKDEREAEEREEERIAAEVDKRVKKALKDAAEAAKKDDKPDTDKGGGDAPKTDAAPDATKKV